MKPLLIALLLVLAACAAGGGTRGPYVGGAIGSSVQENNRLR